MKKLLQNSLLLFLLLVHCLTFANESVPAGATILDDTLQHVYLAFGIGTTLRFPTDLEINEWSMGNPGNEVVKMVASQTVPNSFTLYPQEETGDVNLNMTINGKTYVFLLHIVNDSRVNYTKSFTLEGWQEKKLSSKVSRAPVLNPRDIDSSSAIKIIEKCRIDPVYHQSLSKKIKWFNIGKAYPWNGNIITLYDAVQFIEEDMIVLTVSWKNQFNNKAFYLHVKQYEVYVANQRIYPVITTQITPRVFPGQRDTAYLFIQGHKLKLEQDWSLGLPLEESEILSLR